MVVSVTVPSDVPDQYPDARDDRGFSSTTGGNRLCHRVSVPPGRTVLLVRDGTPLPARTPAQLLSQLAHRVLGPLRPHRIRAVLDYHGLRDAPAAGQAEIAARYGVNVRSVSNWVTTVAAAGAHLPLSPEMATEISRRSRPGEDHRGSRPGEDHRGRGRVASTLGLPSPARPLSPAPAPRPRIPPEHWAAAGIAVRVLATIGPLPLPSLLGAVHRSRRFRARAPVTADDLAAGLLAAHATLADGLWHAPAGAIAPDRDRLVATTLGDRDVSRSELIEALVGAGYARSSAAGRTITTHPLITHVGPARYRLIQYTGPQPTEPPQH